jgi:hypothetical protein
MYTNGYRIPDTTRNFQPSKGDGFGVAVNMEKKRRHVDDNAANIFISCRSHRIEGCHFIFSSFLNDAKGVPLWNYSHL